VKLLLLFLFVVFISCSSKEKIYPAWYNHTINDSETILYASASGYNQKEAIVYALDEISSKINISIKSSIKSSTISNTNEYFKETNIDINIYINYI
jgi:hypothetical protein